MARFSAKNSLKNLKKDVISDLYQLGLLRSRLDNSLNSNFIRDLHLNAVILEA
jgi:hypothetical protein